MDLSDDRNNVIAALKMHLEQLEMTFLGDEPGPRLILGKESLPFDASAFLLSRYAQAIDNSIIQLRRYERSLIAWSKILPTLESATLETIVVDYVIPTHHVAADLPQIIKNQIMHCAVSVHAYLSGDGIPTIKQGDLIKQFNRLIDSDSKLSQLNVALNQLWCSAEAEKLRERHGNIHHGVERQLIGGIPYVDVDPTVPEMTIAGIEPPLSLNEEISTIDAQRLAAEDAYRELAVYIEVLFARSSHSSSDERRQTRSDDGRPPLQ